MAVFIGNAFSLGMLENKDHTIRVREVEKTDVKQLLAEGNFQSIVGHQATANILTQLLETDIPVNRVSVKLKETDTLIVFQLLQRIEEGRVLSEEEVLALPTKWFLVEVLS